MNDNETPGTGGLGELAIKARENRGTFDEEKAAEAAKKNTIGQPSSKPYTGPQGPHFQEDLIKRELEARKEIALRQTLREVRPKIIKKSTS